MRIQTLDKYAEISLNSTTSQNSKTSFLPLFLTIFQVVASFIFPLLIYKAFLIYAANESLVLGVGCEGPGVFFGMLSGVLFALFQRQKYSIPH